MPKDHAGIRFARFFNFKSQSFSFNSLVGNQTGNIFFALERQGSVVRFDFERNDMARRRMPNLSKLVDVDGDDNPVALKQNGELATLNLQSGQEINVFKTDLPVTDNEIILDARLGPKGDLFVRIGDSSEVKSTIYVVTEKFTKAILEDLTGRHVFGWYSRNLTSPLQFFITSVRGDHCCQYDWNFEQARPMFNERRWESRFKTFESDIVGIHQYAGLEPMIFYQHGFIRRFHKNRMRIALQADEKVEAVLEIEKVNRDGNEVAILTNHSLGFVNTN